MAIIIKNFSTEYIDECDAEIQFSAYPNGRTAIRLYDHKSGMPLLTATTNIISHKLEKGEVMIKTWSENVGIVQPLVHAGIISPAKDGIPTGYNNECLATVHDLLRKE